MKKTLFFLAIAGISFNSYAQNVWNGTTIPSTTLGSAGVGTNTPLAKFQVHLNNSAGNTVPNLLVSSANALTGGYPNIMEVQNFANVLGSWTPSLDFAIATNGTVSVKKKLRIGATAANGTYANYALSVDGDIIAKHCVIQVANWADYVFNDNYEMPTLNELEDFVNKNKHLPGVPSANEVKENGIEVGDMNKILLQKVEELTLYMIDLQKQNETLKSRIENLECIN